MKYILQTKFKYNNITQILGSGIYSTQDVMAILLSVSYQSPICIKKKKTAQFDAGSKVYVKYFKTFASAHFQLSF
jgi:hypothetical protein